MRKVLKWIGIALAAAIIVMQFIRPARNNQGADSPNDIISHFHPPQDVIDVLRVSCYDCHSNGTRYPWYAEVQPVGWWLAGHIDDAKGELNFSEFGSYRVRRQYVKLGQIATEIQEDQMPLPSYLVIHTDAVVTPEQEGKIVAWVNAMRDSMKAIYPPDSLERRRPPETSGQPGAR